LRQKIQSASFVVCISDFCRSQVLRIAPGVQEDRLEVVRLGVDCVALRPVHLSSGPTSALPHSNSLRLVCTGRMVAAKGHRILLQALDSLGQSGIEFTCALIGDGPERRSLADLSTQLGIAERVRFLGAMGHAETLSEVAQADVFVLASFAEGLPVALMEAMALGIPCVSTTIAAIPELICDGENGFLVSPANPEALGKALCELAGDVARRQRLGQRARETVEAHYNLTANLDVLAGVWKRRASRAIERV